MYKQTCWLAEMEIHSVTVLEGLRSTVRTVPPTRAWGESSPRLFQHPVTAGTLGYGHTPPVSSLIFIQTSLHCVSPLHVSYKDTWHWI